MGIEVTNEIKTLKKVLLHRPGKELENLIPDQLESLLFDDIPDLKVAQQEHDQLADVLREHEVEVVYLEDLMKQVIETEWVKELFIKQFISESGIQSADLQLQVYDYLNSIKNHTSLIQQTMSGITKKDLLIQQEISEEYNPFIVPPMPNLYFTRDPFASIGNSISMNHMYFPIRNRETIYAEYIFNYHPLYKGTQKVYDRMYEGHIEGGDILNLNEKILAIGISQRTEICAIEALARQLFFEVKETQTEVILAIHIPKKRACMHLDTVLTQVDEDKFIIHPEIHGILEVFEITGGESKTLRIEKLNKTLKDILESYLGYKVNLILCGRGDYITAQREQWSDASNTLCIKPGEVIVYSRNYVTNQLLTENGIKIYEIPCSELSRGRGGPRCMTMPLIRER